MKKIILLGDGGAGKTTTARKLISDIRTNDTLILESSSTKENTPYSTFHQLLDSFLEIDLFGKRETNEAMDQVLAVAGAFLLGPIAGFMDGKNDEGFSKQDIFVSIKDKFKELSKDRKIIIFVDDLQWIDNASKELLKYILDYFKDDDNFTALFTSRHMEDNILFSYLNLENDLQLVGNISKDEQNIFLKNTFSLSNEVTQWIIDWINDVEDVYPSHLIDIVGNLYRNDCLVESDYGYKFSDTFDTEHPVIPTNIKDEIINVLNNYPEYKDIIGICATYGKEFDILVVSDTLGMNIIKLTQILNKIAEETNLIYDLLSKDNFYTFKSQIALDATRSIIGFSTKSFTDTSVPQIMRYYHQILATSMIKYDYLPMQIANHYYASSKMNVKKAITYLIESALVCKNIYQYDEAIDYINKSKELSIADNSYDMKILETELLILADKEFVTGSPSVEFTQRLLEYISPNIEEELKVVTARSCYDSGRLDRKYFETCVKIAQNYLIVSNDDITKAEGYHFAAIGMDNTPENKNIKIAYFQKALKLSKQYKIIYAKVANSYAGYLSFGDVEAKELALKLFNESKDIKENLLIKDLPGLARTYGGLGRLALFSGDESKLKDALENFLEDLKVSIELNDNYGISNMYSFIGTTYKKMKEYDKAIEYYSKSIECDHNKIDIYASLLGILEIKISQNEDIKLSLDQIKKSKVIYGDIPPFLLNDIKNIADKNILEELLIINY